MKCPYCGSSDVVVDDSRGYLVCRRCGTVLGDIYEEATPASLYDTDKSLEYIGSERLNVRDIIRRKSSVYRLESVSLPRSSGGRTTTKALRNDLLVSIINKLKQVKAIPEKRRRSMLAVAHYILLRAEGYPPRRALIKSSRETGISPHTLKSVLREFKGQISEAIERVLVERGGSMGSSIVSKKDTHTDI